MALQYTQITGDFKDAQGNLLNGTASFQPNTTVYASGVPVLQAGVAIQAQIVNGVLENMSGGTLQLLDQGSTGLTFAGQTGFVMYTVTIDVAGDLLDPWSFFLPHSSSPVDLYSLANTSASGGSGAVSSVFGRTGAVVATSGDYSVGQVTGAAPLASPALTGTPTAPTASPATGNTQVATTAYADNSAATAQATAEAASLPLAGGTMAGAIAMGSHKITGLTNGSSAQDAAAFGQIPTSLPPSGSASGDLSGSYPGPSLAKIQGTTVAAPSGGVTAFLNATGTWTVPEVPAVTFTYSSTGAAPSSGTFTAQTIAVDQLGIVRICTVSGTPGTWVRVFAYPWQFFPEDFGAKGNATMLYDVTTTNGSAVITTSGLPAPSSWPLGSQITGSGSGGSLAAGVYQVKQTYVNQFGETLASTAASYTASGGASSIASNSPAPWTNATGYNTYATAANGSTFFKQNTTPTPLRSTFTITSINTGGANPPGANTSNSSPFVSGDATKAIFIPSAGGFLNVPLATTIASYQSAGQVTLSANSTRSVSGSGAVYGTDDTTALQNCLNAAVTYAQTAGAEGDADVEVMLLGGPYAVAGAPGGTNMSAQIQLPYVDPYVGPKVNLRFTMPQSAPGPVHWEQPNPPMPRGTLVSIYYNDSSSGFGPPPNVVVGAPVTGYGGNGGKFSNMRVSGDLNFLTAYRPCIAGLDLYGCAQADMRSVGYFCMAATATAAGGWPPYQSGTGNGSAWQVFGYRTPTTGNNALNKCDVLTAYGAYHAVIYTDHFTAVDVNSVYNFFGATAAPSSTPAHHCSIQSMVCEASGYALYWDNSGTYSGGGAQAITVESLQCEALTDLINDPGNYAQGLVRAEQQGVTGQVGVGKLAGGGANITLVWSNQTLGHVSSPPAVPSSTTALTNNYYLPATVVVHAGSGVTVSVIALDGTATSTTVSASSSSPPIPVRNGGTITLTYSGGTPTWDWWLG